MIDAKRALLILATAAFVPSAGLAASDECPQMPGVLEVIQPEGKGAQINQANLIKEVGDASTSTEDTKGLAGELRQQLPGNEEALIADLMIASYCEYLKTSQSGVALDKSVEDYEKVIYNVVFDDPSSLVSTSQQRPEGWLWGN